MKTVKEWLEELPEPYRSRALAQCVYADRLVGTMHQAFSWGLIFEETDEGDTFWASVRDGEYPPIPTHTPTERQTAEALLKEFGDWWNEGNTLSQDTVITEGAVMDFINDKYGKG